MEVKSISSRNKSTAKHIDGGSVAVSADHRSEISLNASSSAMRTPIAAGSLTANIGRRRNRHTAGLPTAEDLVQ